MTTTTTNKYCIKTIQLHVVLKRRLNHEKTNENLDLYGITILWEMRYRKVILAQNQERTSHRLGGQIPPEILEFFLFLILGFEAICFNSK